MIELFPHNIDTIINMNSEVYHILTNPQGQKYTLVLLLFNRLLELDQPMSVDASNAFEYYNTVSASRMGISRIRHALHGMDRFQCAMACKSNQCRSFMWGKENEMCLLSTYTPAVYGHHAPGLHDQLFSLVETEIESNDTCFSDGLSYWYQKRSTGDLHRCIHLSSIDSILSYSEAREFCKNSGGQLMKTDSPELVQLLSEFANERGIGFPHRIFVGCDDIEREGTFVWSDGDLLSSNDRHKLFPFQFFQIFEDILDCAVYKKYSPTGFAFLDVEICDLPTYFACELEIS